MDRGAPVCSKSAATWKEENLLANILNLHLGGNNISLQRFQFLYSVLQIEILHVKRKTNEQVLYSIIIIVKLS